MRRLECEEWDVEVVEGVRYWTLRRRWTEIVAKPKPRRVWVTCRQLNELKRQLQRNAVAAETKGWRQ